MADRTLRGWDAPTGGPLLTFIGHTTPVWACAYFPSDGRHIASTSFDHTLRVWTPRRASTPCRTAPTPPMGGCKKQIPGDCRALVSAELIVERI
ncbi:MAG: hypothetical protein H0U97_12725 [Gammaproteobacteria bacterium]|nr:hypothetical protein [Gammaproteobacteria bacterium]